MGAGTSKQRMWMGSKGKARKEKVHRKSTRKKENGSSENAECFLLPVAPLSCEGAWIKVCVIFNSQPGRVQFPGSSMRGLQMLLGVGSFAPMLTQGRYKSMNFPFGRGVFQGESSGRPPINFFLVSMPLSEAVQFGEAIYRPALGQLKHSHPRFDLLLTLSIYIASRRDPHETLTYFPVP